MKCWIDGSECFMHSREDYGFGLLNVVTPFCKECSVITYNNGITENILKEIGINLFETLISEDDEYNLYDKMGIILDALELFIKNKKKKIKKAIKAGNEERRAKLDNKLKDIKSDIKWLKTFFDKLAES